MKKLDFIFFILTIFLLTSACSSTNVYTLSNRYKSNQYYAPNSGTELALNEKNDFKISASATELTNIDYDSDNSNCSLLLGYSPMKHLGVQSSFFKLGKVSKYNQSGNLYFADIAIGSYYFIPLKKMTKASDILSEELGMKRGLLFDFYAGYGKGMINHDYSVFSSSQLHYRKIYLQLGLHLQGRVAGFDYVHKFGNLDYQTGTIVAFSRLDETEQIPIQEVLSFDTYPIREVTVRFHAGTKFARFFITMSWLHRGGRYAVNNSSFIGVLFDIDAIANLKKAQKVNSPNFNACK